MTTESGLALVVRGADCPLVALADPQHGVIGVAHSGWRGTVAHVAGRCVEEARRAGAAAGELVAAVFPGIGPCCFEVGADVREAFAGAGDEAAAWFEPRGDRWHLDLHAAIAATLVRAGVAADRIDLVAGCTACDGRFYSHRASRGAPARHGLAVTRTA